MILDASVAFSVENGSASILGRTAGEQGKWVDVTGQLVLYTWRAAMIPTVDSNNSFAQPFYPLERARNETFDLRHGNMTLRVENKTNLSIVASDGLVTARGETQETGLFALLRAPVNSGIHTRTTGSPDVVTWVWQPGWPFVGHFDNYAAWIDGFPTSQAMRVGVQGAARMQIEGGDIEFDDASGNPHSIPTGSWTEAPGAFDASPGSVVQTFQRVVFNGTIGSADLPIAESWGVSGPSARWLLDGHATWEDASGSVAARGGARSFQHARVEARGAFSMNATSDGASPVGDGVWSYEGEGQFLSVLIDGEPVDGSDIAGKVVAGATAAVALALAWILYTRIAAAQLLDHPKRRRILEIVGAEPGIHLKELARRVGGGWGMFRAHVALLRKAGYLRTEPHGRYTLVFPTGASLASSPHIPNRTARALFDALPEDGGTVPLREISARVGISRQLASYHVARLAKQGFVRTEPATSGGRLVARAPTLSTNDASKPESPGARPPLGEPDV